MFWLLCLRVKNPWYLLGWLWVGLGRIQDWLWVGLDRIQDWLWVGLGRIHHVGTICAISLLNILVVLTDCSVLSRLQAQWPKNGFFSWHKEEVFLFPASSPAVGLNQPSFWFVGLKSMEYKTDHLPPSSGRVQHGWTKAFTSLSG
jgi:hypothetical protein